MITKFGLEGNAIYGLSPQIREALSKDSKATIFIDFKPSFTLENVLSKINSTTQKNTTARLNHCFRQKVKKTKMKNQK